MIILFANTKGGVGKSTLASHLAIYLHDQGKVVSLLDSDKQASSFTWVSEAEPKISVARETDPDMAAEKLFALKNHFEYVVCDSPGDINETSRTLMLLADLAVFPVGPSILDLRSLADAAKTLRYAQRINGGRPEGMICSASPEMRHPLS